MNMVTNGNPPDLIRSDPAQDKSATQLRVSQLSFSGPLPPPAALEAYERIQKGAADRIITMAERQAGHRQSLEKTVVETLARNERFGMWFAFILTAVLMIIGGILLAVGKSIAGYLAVFIPVIFHAGNFVYVKHGMAKMQSSESEKLKSE